MNQIDSGGFFSIVVHKFDPWHGQGAPIVVNQSGTRRPNAQNTQTFNGNPPAHEPKGERQEQSFLWQASFQKNTAKAENGPKRQEQSDVWAASQRRIQAENAGRHCEAFKITSVNVLARPEIGNSDSQVIQKPAFGNDAA